MRIALIADIHGNLAALDAVLAALAPAEIDRFVCLGDVAATGPQPREALSRLRELNCPVVMGNADAVFLDPPPAGSASDDDTRRIAEIDRWCANQLEPDDLAFLRTFRSTIDLPLGDDGHLLCYHGSPRSFDDFIAATTPAAELEPMLASARASIMAGGHTHFQMLRRHEDLTLINPGSVGLAYDLQPDGDARVPPWADYAVLTANHRRLGILFQRVPYDSRRTVQAMFTRGMPHAAWWSEAWRQ